MEKLTREQRRRLPLAANRAQGAISQPHKAGAKGNTDHKQQNIGNFDRGPPGKNHTNPLGHTE